MNQNKANNSHVNKKLIPMILCIGMIITIFSFVFPESKIGYSADNTYYSPFDTVYSPDGSMIAVSDSTKAQLEILSALDGKVQKTIPLVGQPKALAWNGNENVYVCEYGAGTVAEVNPVSGEVTRRFTTGSKPLGVAVIDSKLVVSDYGLKKVSVVDLSSGDVEKDINVKNYPYLMDGTVDGKYAIVGHALPSGNAFEAKYAASVSFIDMNTYEEVANLVLPQGSSNVKGIKCSPDGKWAYVLHTFGKTSLPTTQITRGWVITNAVTIIDIENKNIYTTFLLDRMMEGAADPWGLTISNDSKTMWVSVSGTHQVLKIDLYGLHQLLKGNLNGDTGSSGDSQFNSNAYYKIVNRNSGKALDVPGGNTANNVQLVQWNDVGNNNQQYKIVADSDGYYTIINRGTNKAIDNAGSRTDNSAVVQWDVTSSDNQKWKIIDAGNGYSKLQVKSTNKYLDVSGQSLNNDAGIVSNSESTSFSQQWQISIAGTASSGGNNFSVLNRSKAGMDKPYSDIWLQIKADPSKKSDLKYDLGALWGAGLLKEIELPGQGPRGITLSPDGKTVAVGAYYAGEVYFIDAAGNKVISTSKLGNQPEENQVRSGERIFHDASTTTQKWLSCASCHPDGKADGLNWDMPNDGIGNTKNTKSMLDVFDTPPAMWRGIRDDAHVGVVAGFKYIKFKEPTQQEVDDVSAYIKNMTEEPDPYSINGNMTADAVAGKAIFESKETKCSYCHSGALYTDLKSHDVGTKDILDSDGLYYTPTLKEMWRTAPYLHDGSAPTIRDVLTTKNVGDKHGKTSQLTAEQINQLEAYILQIDSNPTEIPVVEKGDVNGDGEFNAIDFALLKKYLMGEIEFTDVQKKAADVDDNGEINAIDFAIMKQVILGAREGF